MTKEQFISYLKNPETLDQTCVEELKEIINDYPYFSAARMLYLRTLRNLNSYRFESELAKHAIFIPNRKVLYTLLTNANKPALEFELLPYDKDAFDRFFDSNVPTDNNLMQLPETVPFELINEQPEAINKTIEEPIDLIDRFIIENPTIKGAGMAKGSENLAESESRVELDDSLITETLASVYVKQGLYEDALKAYEKLSLKFPEKNIYFGSQIEKIKKLISKES